MSFWWGFLCGAIVTAVIAAGLFGWLLWQETGLSNLGSKPDP